MVPLEGHVRFAGRRLPPMRRAVLVAAALACFLGVTGEARGEPFAPGTILTADRRTSGGTPLVLALDPTNGLGRPILVHRLCRETTELSLAVAPDILQGGDIVVANQFGAYRLNTTTGGVTQAFKRLLPVDVEAGPNGRVVVGHSDGTLRSIDLATGVQAAFVKLADDLPPYYQFAFAPSGDLYVASRDGITRHEAGTWTASAVLTPPPGEEFAAGDVAIAPSGEIFVTQGSRIVRVDPVTGALTVVSEGGEFGRLQDIAVGPTGEIFVAGDFVAGRGTIVRVDPATGAQSYINPGSSFRVGNIAVAPGGDILAATTRGLLRVDPTTGGQSDIPVARGRYHYLEVLPGDEVVASTRGLFVRVALASGAVTPLSPVNPTLSGIAVTPDGEILLAHGHAGILRVGRDSPRARVLADGGALVSPVGVAVAPNGDVVAADPAAAGGRGAVIRVSAATGTQRLVSDGGTFTRLAGVAVAPTGAIFVTDTDAAGGSGAVIWVDPSTGGQAVISAGGFFSSPAGIALGSDSDVLIADSDALEGRGAIIRVDLASGAQTVLASGERFVSLAVVPGRRREPTTTTTTMNTLTTTTITVTTTSLPAGGGTLPPPPAEAGAERCDNCADDDGDGLVDYEDPACCGSVGSLKGRWFTSGKRKHRLHLNVVLRAAGMDPRTQPVTVLVRDAKAPLRCDVLASEGWRKERRGFVFPETKDTEGLKVARLRFRAGGSARLRALSRKGVVAGLSGPELTATVHIGGRCATGNLRFVGKRPPKARPACSGRRPC